jgi:hypothetical protein
MTTNPLVVSYETAVKLKDAGVKQETFIYYFLGQPGNLHIHIKGNVYFSYLNKGVVNLTKKIKSDYLVAAPTFTEIWRELPKRMKNKEDWMCDDYINLSYDKTSQQFILINYGDNYVTMRKTEAEAAAQMWLKLKEEGKV